MLYPAAHELKKHVNSKYLIVSMAAKRASIETEFPNGMVKSENGKESVFDPVIRYTR